MVATLSCQLHFKPWTHRAAATPLKFWHLDWRLGMGLGCHQITLYLSLILKNPYNINQAKCTIKTVIHFIEFFSSRSSARVGGGGGRNVKSMRSPLKTIFLWFFYRTRGAWPLGSHGSATGFLEIIVHSLAVHQLSVYEREFGRLG